MKRTVGSSAAGVTAAMTDGQRGKISANGSTRRVTGRRHGRHREPYSWLGAGAVTLGVGAALAVGSGVAHADGQSPGGSSSSRHTESSASEPGGGPGGSRGSLGKTRLAAGNVSPAETLGVRHSDARAAATVRGSAPSASTANPVGPGVLDHSVPARVGVRGNSVPTRASTGVLDDSVPTLSGAGVLNLSVPTFAAAAVSSAASSVATGAGAGAGAAFATAGAAASTARPATGAAAVMPSAVTAPSARAVPTLPPRLGLMMYRFVLTHGLNTPTAPTDAFGALLWGLFRRIETVYGFVPVAGTPTMSTPSRTTGAVSGEVGYTVPAGLPLGYTMATEPTQGSVTLGSTGYYTYTPNASATGHTDSFEVIASTDWAATPVTVTVPVVVPTASTTPASIASIGVGAQPIAVAFSPDGRHAYVTGSTDTWTGQGTVSVIDTATKTVIATIGNGGIPTGVAVSPEGGTVYVAAPARYDITPASLLMIDTSTNVATTIAVGKVPAGVAISPDGSTAYVADWAHYGQSSSGADTVWVIDTAAKAVIGQISVGSEPHALVASPDGRRAYVINNGNGVPGSSAMSVIDTAADSASVNTVIATLKVGIEPIDVAVSPDGRHAYVTDLYDGSVRVIDTATNQLTAKIGIGGVLGGVAVSPDGKRVYVADQQGAVAVIDAATNTLVGAIRVDGVPQGVAVSPDSSEIYVVKMYDQSVSVISV